MRKTVNGSGLKITERMKCFLEKELQEIMANYAKFRSEIVKTANGVESMEDVSGEEVIWENKIRQIKNLLYNKEIVSPVKQKEVVELGSQVVLSHQNDREDWLILDGVGYKKGDIRIISIESPIGRQLIGKKRQDKVCHEQTELVIKDIFYPW